MRTYTLEDRGGAPLYASLYRCIREDILNGTLAAGERLPSKRALAEHLHLSVMTVEGAYQQLEAEGYVYTRPRRGFFVAEVEQPRPAPPAPPLPEAPEGYRCEVSRTEDSGLTSASIEVFWGDTALYTLETSWIPALSGDSGEEVALP